MSTESVVISLDIQVSHSCVIYVDSDKYHINAVDVYLLSKACSM